MTKTAEELQVERDLKASLKASHPGAVFATIPKVGLIALGPASYDDFLAYLDSTASRSQDKVLAWEQLVIDGLVYPEGNAGKKAVRKVLRAMPFLLQKYRYHEAVELCSRKGDTGSLELTDEARAELEEKNEFGISGFNVVGFGNVVLTTKETSSPLVRVVINESQGRCEKIGQKMVAAILASAVEPDRASLEALLTDRPGLIPPAWIAVMELTGDADGEIEKN